MLGKIQIGASFICSLLVCLQVAWATPVAILPMETEARFTATCQAGILKLGLRWQKDGNLQVTDGAVDEETLPDDVIAELNKIMGVGARVLNAIGCPPQTQVWSLFFDAWVASDANPQILDRKSIAIHFTRSGIRDFRILPAGLR